MTQQQLTNTISILGCGWLGLPLAESFISQSYHIKGSVTSIQKLPLLAEKGILPYQVEITDTAVTGTAIPAFLDSDILIINIPPSRREDIVSYHPAQLSLLIQQIKSSRIQQVVFISATSVYPDLNREVTEDETLSPSKGSGSALLAAEQLLLQETAFTTTIIRFAGLIGYDRHPGRFLAGKKHVENGNAPVNIIHRDDCIGLINEMVRQQAWGGIFNACSDIHPTRKAFYTLATQKVGLEAPTFADSTDCQFKIINSDKIKQRLQYTFKYPDPMKAV
jgi:nucleoside-diphosphate-sugar epimerase